MKTAKQLATLAKQAAPTIALATTSEKNDLLKKIAYSLQMNATSILEANEKDIQRAKQNNMNEQLLDRLRLTADRLEQLADSVLQLIHLPDEIGDLSAVIHRPNGLVIEERIVPFGVVGMIYEARPNVTVDACALALKTSNAIVLRGSSSAVESNKALVHTLKKAFEQTTIDPNCINLLENTSKAEATQFIKLKGLIDVLIPRGGAALIQKVVEEATIPVIETGVGNCHIYVAKSADLHLTKSIVLNAKTQRPSVCNACETLVVHEDFAKRHLSSLAEALLKEGVTLLGDSFAQSLHASIGSATDTDWSTEYLDLTLAIRCVSSTIEAISHINTFGTKHSDAIITNDNEEKEVFFTQVDSACVYHNASTRFTDGFEFGFGAEIGISTQKLHARGPMGLKALTTTKYCISGNGQIK
ncbi:gamma-glutamyl phosphate reductase [Bacillus sp. JCM 19045]|uniref:Gamma-glutamyl phosphate reductase n=1 Tax=Shouchella xiaoxiensis TaxID=766895 RepID=A0ABS2SSL2_9BACI|nr:glutamate-5-semialdehyde dehydrogenase [Shouchella xiaoxiensis]MBM7838186.1 glutamate-5-semialdehyde dehydrogenase [Shouchella xiaoxiensis]GAF12060.1 gamma-glutamyl phosphate reductase [Bacillus sp. JCM 19045]